MTKSPTIGHNRGPPLDGEERQPDPGGMRLYAWRKAHRAAFRAPSVEALRTRTERANAVGISYAVFTAVRLDRGRNLTTLFFVLTGALVRRRANAPRLDARGEPGLMPGVREKLRALHPEAMFVIDDAYAVTRAALASVVRQVSAACGVVFTDWLFSDARDARSLRPTPAPDLVQKLLEKHARTPGESLIVGDEVRHEECAKRANAALFIWAWRYFGDREATSSAKA